MGKIFCLIGKSSTGKDTILSELKKDIALNLKQVIPYTTRPIRVNELHGREYYFIDEQTLQAYKAKGKIIELREYNTINGVWAYCTINDGQIDLNKNNYILIVTLEAYKNLKDYFGEENIKPFYICVDDGIRLERALEREKMQQRPNYEELCRRFLADCEDFSEHKLRNCNINKYYFNVDLSECLTNIKSDIISFML